MTRKHIQREKLIILQPGRRSNNALLEESTFNIQSHDKFNDNFKLLDKANDSK